VSGDRKAVRPKAGPKPKPKSGDKPKEPRTTKERIRWAVKWMSIAGLVGALIAAGGLFYLYKTTPIPDPNSDFLTETTYIYYSDGKTELGHLARQERDSLAYGDMPQCIKDAVVAAENRSFWTDNGIDFKGIVRAAFNNAQGGATQGASTITQQYVKILYLSQERTIKRKIKEAILTLKIQKELSKTQILEGYLNTIYFGRGAYGIQAAAQAFFDKNANDLKLNECAVLASVINNPSEFDPANGKDNRTALSERMHYVLDGMAVMGTITAAQADKADRLPKFPPQTAEDTYGGQRGHALSMVKQQLLQLGFSDDQIQGGGLRVTTTLTKKAMDAAKDGVNDQRPEGFSPNHLHIGVASVEPGTGALRGFFGGQDYLKSQINWALAGGMAGSTFKAFALAAAITDGYSLKDTFQGDSPYTFPDGLDVVNEGCCGGTDYGKHVSMLKAAEDSINTAFVDMTNSMDDGPHKVYDAAVSMGIPPAKAPKKNATGFPTSTRDFSSDDTLITLGKARPSAVNMANAYATIANGGEAADVYVIEKVVDKSGEELYHHEVTNHRAVEEDVDADVSYALQNIVKNGTGQNALALGRPAAGKTGTATGGTDSHVSSSWFVGYTPQLATAVMYVRGDGDDQLDGWLPSYFGADYPTRTWTEVMDKALDGEPIEDFPPPANVDGEAPEDGHAPYTPPPKPTKTPTITESPTLTPTETPSHTPPGHISDSPTPTASETCTLIPPKCTTSTPTPTPTPTDTTSPTNVGNGNSPRRRQLAGRRRRRLIR
jgi:membrane peptidoglycan carboxypeptidase